MAARKSDQVVWVYWLLETALKMVLKASTTRMAMVSATQPLVFGLLSSPLGFSGGLRLGLLRSGSIIGKHLLLW